MTFTNPSQNGRRAATRAVAIGAVAATLSIGLDASAQERQINCIADQFVRPTTGFLHNIDSGETTTIAHPDAPQATEAFDINNAGQIVGGYVSGDLRGFLRQTDGTFDAIDFPGATATLPLKINNRGQVLGFYEVGDNTCFSFVYERGRYDDIEIPDTIAVQAVGFNDVDQIVGGFIEPDGTARAFRSNAGVITIFPDVPESVSTQLFSINNAGELLGAFLDDQNVPHSFFIDENGFTPIEVGATLTVALDVNNLPQIVGFYLEDGRRRGFLREGSYTRTIDAGPNVDTTIFGNNDARQLVGAAEERASTPSAAMETHEPEMHEPEMIVE